MVNTSVSKSSAVTIIPIHYEHNNCPNVLRSPKFGPVSKVHSTPQDVKPMSTGKPKEEEKKKVESKEEKPCDICRCCSWVFALS